MWLLRPGPVIHWHRGQALCLEARPCPPVPPVPSTLVPPVPSTPVPPAPSTQVGPGVLLCWLAPSLPRVRYKTLPARLLGGDNGIKLSPHVEKAPNRAISGEQGEFYTGNAARAGMQGEFYTGNAARAGMQGEFCTAHAARAGTRGEFCTGSWAVRLVLGEICFVVAPSACSVAGLPPPTGTPAWPSGPSGALHASGGGGFAALGAGCRRVAGVSRLSCCNSPRLVVARPWFAAVWHPHRRPPR